MDIKNIAINHIEIFDFAYTVAKDVFKVEPTEARPSKQKKIRKWVMKTYIDESELPKKVLHYIDNLKSDSEFIESLFECIST